MKNSYQIVDNKVLIDVYGKGKQYVTTVDLDVLPRLQAFGGTWYVNFIGQYKKPYVCLGKMSDSIHKGGVFQVHKLHRFVIGVEGRMSVDHVDGDTFNNCKDNLRIVSNFENGLNRKNKPYIDVHSGIKGITRYGNRWRVRMYAPKLKQLGYVNTLEDAKELLVKSYRELAQYTQEQIDEVLKSYK